MTMTLVSNWQEPAVVPPHSEHDVNLIKDIAIGFFRLFSPRNRRAYEASCGELAFIIKFRSIFLCNVLNVARAFCTP